MVKEVSGNANWNEIDKWTSKLNGNGNVMDRQGQITEMETELEMENRDEIRKSRWNKKMEDGRCEQEMNNGNRKTRWNGKLAGNASLTQ